MTETAVVQRSLFVANALCMLSMVVWSIGLPAISHLVQIMPPLTLTAYRLGISGVVLVLAWGFWEGWSTVRHAPWLRGIGIGFVVMGVVAVMVAIAIKLTDPVTVAIVTALMPLVGIALECLLDGRRLTLALVLGMLLSLVGGLVALDVSGATPALGLGALAAFVSVLAFAWGSRASVISLPDLTPLGRTAITVGGAGISMSALAAVVAYSGGASVDWSAFGLLEVGALLLSSIGSVALSQTLWIISVGLIGIGISSLHMNAVPFYVMLITLTLGGSWNWAQAIGAAIVVAGVCVAQGVLSFRRT